VTAAAVLGSLAPDLSLYLMASWALYVQGIAPEVVFGQLYFSSVWQDVFAVDNSIPLWTLALMTGLALRSPVAAAFAGAGLLHLAFDLPLHNEDARRHFWPLSDWVFRSPFSYWDQSRHAGVIGALEIAACVALSVLLWRRFRNRLARVLIALALFAEAMPGLMFALMLD
jgi:hypothetical protein